MPSIGLCHTGTRDDKLIKTVVVHDGSLPVRYYMFLFPDVEEPKEDLGGPLFLTPLLQQGRVQEARWRAKFRKYFGIYNFFNFLGNYPGLVSFLSRGLWSRIQV